MTDSQNRRGGVQHRQSNLELLRIIAMFSIVAHHFVVNSGITAHYDLSSWSGNMIFLQIWGMWGKVAINAFVMITGYFMCTSKVTTKRFLKMYLEILFYRYGLYIFFLLMGREPLTIRRLFTLVFATLRGVNSGFSSSFMFFYLFIPFYNLLLEKLDKRKLQILIGLLLFTQTITATFFFNWDVFNFVMWYMTIYFIAAYFRLYPSAKTESNKICMPLLAGSIVVSLLGIFAGDYIGNRIGMTGWYYHLVNDSNKIMALLVGVFAFLVFKNMKIKYSPIINTVATATFGVLLIHAGSDAMRQFLWKDLLHVSDMFFNTLPMLIVKTVGLTTVIYSVCTAIDLVRIKLVEDPLFKKLEKTTWINKTLYWE